MADMEEIRSQLQTAIWNSETLESNCADEPDVQEAVERATDNLRNALLLAEAREN